MRVLAGHGSDAGYDEDFDEGSSDDFDDESSVEPYHEACHEDYSDDFDDAYSNDRYWSSTFQVPIYVVHQWRLVCGNQLGAVWKRDVWRFMQLQVFRRLGTIKELRVPTHLQSSGIDPTQVSLLRKQMLCHAAFINEQVRHTSTQSRSKVELQTYDGMGRRSGNG